MSKISKLFLLALMGGLLATGCKDPEPLPEPEDPNAMAVKVAFGDATWTAEAVEAFVNGNILILNAYSQSDVALFPSVKLMALSAQPGTHTGTASINNQGQYAFQEGSEVMRLYYFENGGLGASIGDWAAQEVSYTIESFDAATLEARLSISANMVDFMAAMGAGSFEGVASRPLSVQAHWTFVNTAE